MASGEGVDSTHRTFVSYIDKSREFYLAQGFNNPYRWAHFDDVPFKPVAVRIADACIALITTASEIHEGIPQTAKTVFSLASATIPERLYTDHRSWDKDATHTDDLDSYFPAHRLEELAALGRIGRLAVRFHGVPTEYSQRKTMEEDAPEVLQRCREDGVDAAILVPL